MTSALLSARAVYVATFGGSQPDSSVELHVGDEVIECAKSIKQLPYFQYTIHILYTNRVMVSTSTCAHLLFFRVAARCANTAGDAHMPQLRRLAWPPPARVDISRDFRWLVESDDGNADGSGAAANACAGEQHMHQYEKQSPYAQLLRQPRVPRAPLSPAQRAAKKMLQLRLELLGVEDCGGDDDEKELAKEPTALAGECSWREKTVAITSDATKARHAMTESREMTRSKLTLTTTTVTSAALTPPTSKHRLVQKQSRTDTGPSTLTRMTRQQPLVRPPMATAPPASNAKRRLESTEKRELRQLREKQERLAEWIAADGKSKHTRKRDGSGAYDSSFDTRSSPPLVTYSIEVGARIYDAMEATRGRGLWGDQVASLIASEMTSEAVFGGLIKTRRMALRDSDVDAGAAVSTISPKQSPDTRAVYERARGDDASLELTDPIDTTSTPNCPEEIDAQDVMVTDADLEPFESDSSSLIHERAMEIRQEAQSLVRAGNIEDALATLQDGIQQLLFDLHDNQDEIQQHGFNYSQDAHDKATRVQLKYRTRHRNRVLKCVVLQRMWRCFHAKKTLADAKQYRDINAAVIQRYYKARFRRIRRRKAATRIQNCFRIFKGQKLLIYWRRACRKLLEDSRRKQELLRLRRDRLRRLWTKVGAVLAMRSLWKSRFRAIACIQSHWRGSRVRRVYAVLLEASVAVEQARRSREDQFVQARIERAVASYRRFLTKTLIGREIVRWQMNKPWLRYKRVRAEDWREGELAAKVQALHGIVLCGKQSSSISTLRLRTLGHLLGIERHRVERIRSPLQDASDAAMYALFQSCLATDTFLDDATVVLSASSKRSRMSAWCRKRALRAHAWWKNLVLAVGRTLLLLYWYAVIFPVSFVLVRTSSINRQRATDLLEAQQRVALVKYLRHTYRVIYSASAARPDVPSLICKFCSEGFATASTFNPHVRVCKQQHHAEFVEWRDIGRDLVFLEHKVAPLSRNPESLFGGNELTLDALVEETLRVRHREQQRPTCLALLKDRRRSCDRKVALRLLLDTAVCCDGCPFDESADIGDEDARGVALELVAYLLRAMHPETLHPLALPQLNAFVGWNIAAKRGVGDPHWVDPQELLARFQCLRRTRTFGSPGAVFAAVAATILHVVDGMSRRVGNWWRHAKTSSVLTATPAASKYRRASAGGSATVLPVS